MSPPLLPVDKVPQARGSLSSTGPDHGCHVVSWWLGIPAALAQSPQAEQTGTLWPGASCSGGPPPPAWPQGSCQGKWGGWGAVSPQSPQDRSRCGPDGAGSP